MTLGRIVLAATTAPRKGLDAPCTWDLAVSLGHASKLSTERTAAVRPRLAVKKSTILHPPFENLVGGAIPLAAGLR